MKESPVPKRMGMGDFFMHENAWLTNIVFIENLGICWAVPQIR